MRVGLALRPLPRSCSVRREDFKRGHGHWPFADWDEVAGIYNLGNPPSGLVEGLIVFQFTNERT